MYKPLIVANWKMNPSSRREALRLARRASESAQKNRKVEVILAPPFPYLDMVGRVGSSFALAAQDAFWKSGGAYTGEISPPMLKDLGVRYVILGHSERRKYFGDSDNIVSLKVKAVLASRLTPIIAIGEEAIESQEVVPQIIFQQLSSALRDIPKRRMAGVIIAYEPVWALSTTPGARPDTPDDATRRAIYIRKLLTKILGRRVADTIRIIYGGSVSSKNASSFLSSDIRGMEGLLVGGASLDPEEFARIVAFVAGKNR